MFKKEYLQTGMLLEVKPIAHGMKMLGVISNTNKGLYLVDVRGFNIKLDLFDSELKTYNYRIDKIYGFADPCDSINDSLETREILWERK